MAKTAQQVLLSQPEKDEVLALAIVRQESQAEIIRHGWDLAKPALQHVHGGVLRELDSALEGMDLTEEERSAALAEMASVKVRADGKRRRLRVSDLRDETGAWRADFPWSGE